MASATKTGRGLLATLGLACALAISSAKAIGAELPGRHRMVDELTLKTAGSLLAVCSDHQSPSLPPDAECASAPAGTVGADQGLKQAPKTQVLRLDPDSASRLAVAQSPAVIAAATDVQVKGADLESARLVWRPTISLQNAANYGRGLSTSFQAVQRVIEPGVPSGFSKGDYMSNTLVVSFPLYYNATWYGGETPLAVQAEGSQAVAKETVFLQAAAASNLVVKAYFNAAVAREQQAIYQAEYSGKLRALEAVRQRVADKQGVLAEQLFIESSVAAALAGINTTTSLLATSLTQLRSLLGLLETEALELAAVPDAITQLPTLADLITNTVDEHPKVRTQRANVQIAKGALLQAQGNYKPTMTFATTYTGASGFERDYPTFSSVGITLSVPITDFGQSDAKIRSKALAVTQSEQQLESIRANTVRDLASAYHAVLQATAQVPPALAKFRQLTEIERTTQARYDLEQVSVDKLIDSQYDVLGQRIAMLASKYSAWGAYADLLTAAGLPYSTQALKNSP